MTQVIECAWVPNLSVSNDPWLSKTSSNNFSLRTNAKAKALTDEVAL